MTGMGKVIRMRSVTILTEALKNHKNSLGIQLPVREESQNKATGTQLKMSLKIVQKP